MATERTTSLMDEEPSPETSTTPAAPAPPVYAHLFWPLPHLHSIFSHSRPQTPGPQLKASPFATPFEHVATVFASLRAFLLAYFCIFVLPKWSGSEYPAFGPAQSYEWSWFYPLCVRNVLGTWLICGFWDWVLYLSPLSKKFSPFKINPVYPTGGQLAHDAFFTTLASLTAALVEAVLCHWYATGMIQFQRDLWETPVANGVWALCLTHLRVSHFYFMHRVMHPWRKPWLKRTVGDPGA